MFIYLLFKYRLSFKITRYMSNNIVETELENSTKNKTEK